MTPEEKEKKVNEIAAKENPTDEDIDFLVEWVLEQCNKEQKKQWFREIRKG